MCGPTPPVKISLTIGATTQNPYPPTLTDDKGFTTITEDGDKNVTTLVMPGNIMIWKMTEDIIQINSVTETGGDAVFSKDPSLQSDGTWQAVVGNFPTGNTQAYSITYTVKGAPGNPYTQDPKMRINPPQTF
ncbi:MAG: hypothetical protein ACSHXF_10305 [Aquaticitalea sp.]